MSAPSQTPPKGDGVIWRPDPNRTVNEPAYFHQVDDLLAKYLPHAGLSDALVFEDHEGRWLVAKVWDFSTRSFELDRALLPLTEVLP